MAKLSLADKEFLLIGGNATVTGSGYIISAFMKATGGYSGDFTLTIDGVAVQVKNYANAGMTSFPVFTRFKTGFSTSFSYGNGRVLYFLD